VADNVSLPEELVPVAPPEEVSSPAERLQKELRPRITGQDEVDLHNLIVHDCKDALDDRLAWEQRLRIWDEQYYGILPEKSFPWPGCSNVHVPITMVGVETLKPRLVEAVLGEQEPVILVPTEGTDDEVKERTEDFFNWQVQTELGLDELVPDSAHRYLTPGTILC